MKNVKFKLIGTALNYEHALDALNSGKLVSNQQNLNAGILFCQQPVEEVFTSVLTQFKRFPTALVNVFKMETPEPTSENNPIVKILPTLLAVDTNKNEVVIGVGEVLREEISSNPNQWFEVQAYVPDLTNQEQTDQNGTSASGENNASATNAPEGNNPPDSKI